MFERVKNFWYDSWSQFLGWTKVAAGGVLTGITVLGSIVNDPSVKSALIPFELPMYVGLGIALLGAMSLIAMSHRND